MGLKRRESKSYSVEEMMNIINKNFIKGGNNSGEDKRIYVISSTCFQDDSKRFLMCDSRDEDAADEEADELDNLLQTYYGRTISEVVTKAFIDRHNHG